MKEIPTSEKFLDFDIPNKDDYDDAIRKAIEFAKLHVEAALKEAYNKARVNPNYSSVYDDPEDRAYTVNKNSILNAYPLTNVK